MSHRLSIALSVSILIHFSALCFLFWLSFWQQRQAATLSEAGGVVWFNLNPGGSGTGGEGGIGAPLPVTGQAPASQVAPEEKPPQASKKTKDEASAAAPKPVPKKKPTLQVTQPLPEAASAPQPTKQEMPPSGWQGPGQGDEGGTKTGSGGGLGEGLGNGQSTGVGPGQGPGGIGPPGTGGSGSGGEANKILAQIRDKIARAKRYPRQARSEGLEGVCGLSFEINPDGSIAYVKLSKSSGYGLLDEEAVATVRRASPFPYYAGPIRFSLRFSLKDTL